MADILTYSLINNDTEYKVTGYTGEPIDVVIPSEYNGKPVTSIGSRVFWNCDSLTSVNIGDSVTTIGEGAFAYCDGLTSIVIGNSVTTIENSAFECCSSLTSIKIPDGVTSIGDDAFFSCRSLTSIIIPDSVVMIGENTFKHCDSLQYNIEGDLKYLGNNNSPYIYLADVASTDITSVIINGNCRFINSSVFSNCNGLTNIEIPEMVTYISDHTFSNCDNLMSVVFNGNITHIGQEAFSGCNSLQEINLLRCTKVPFLEVRVEEEFDNEGRWLYDIFYRPFDGTPSNLQILVPEALYEGWVADEDWSYYTNQMVAVETPQEGQELAYNLLDNNTYEVVGMGTFIGSNLIIPSEYNGKPVTSIGNEAFYSCEILTRVAISDGVASIGIGAFYGCRNLKSVIIPDSVTLIDDYAFTACTSLTSVVIPDSVTMIGSCAFSVCTGLTSVIIGNSVTTINDEAFSFCDSLTSVVIGSGVTAIGYEAFYGCGSLTSITLLSKTPADIYSETFTNIPATAKFYCPFSALQNYQTATNWNVYADNFIADDLRLNFIMNAQSTKKYVNTQIDSLEERILIELDKRPGGGGGGTVPSDYNIADGNLPEWNTKWKTFVDSGKNVNDFVDNTTFQTEIAPLTDAEVDAIWNNAIGTAEVATVDQIIEEKLSIMDIGKDKPQKISFAYYNEDMLPANSKHPIQANGSYMCYCNNPKLKICDANGDVIRSGAKQLTMMTAHGAKTPYSTKFKACGQMWTGGLSALAIDGFRVTLNEGAYVTADEEFAVCEMICDKKTTKVLFIGNSHSQDTFMPFSEVFRAEGQVDYLFGLCKKEGSSVQDHSNNILNKVADYAYYESTPTSQESYTNPFGKDDVDGELVRVTIDRVLKQHEWDYVFIQLSPFDLADDTVFATDRKVIVNRIKDIQPNAKVGYACPWLAPYDDDITKMETLDGPRKTWYDAMVAKGGTTAAGQYGMFCNAIKNNILNDSSCSMISAAGSSVYYANQILKVGSNVLYRDVLHLSKGLGRLLAAYTVYAQLMQASGKISSLSEIKLDDYVLGSYTLTSANKNMILESINYILQNPWVVPTGE